MIDEMRNILLREEVRPSDRAKVFNLLSDSGFFLPREMAFGMDLFDEHLRRGENSHYKFMIYEQDETILGYGCYGPIRLSDKRYHLPWLAIDRRHHHHGIGRRLEAAVTDKIRSLGGAKIYAETSNREYHTVARSFYESCGYRAAATVPDYYGDNDDMVFFVKDLILADK